MKFNYQQTSKISIFTEFQMSQMKFFSTQTTRFAIDCTADYCRLSFYACLTILFRIKIVYLQSVHMITRKARATQYILFFAEKRTK